MAISFSCFPLKRFNPDSIIRVRYYFQGPSTATKQPALLLLHAAIAPQKMHQAAVIDSGLFKGGGGAPNCESRSIGDENADPIIEIDVKRMEAGFSRLPILL
jgi:hypothetical protein